MNLKEAYDKIDNTLCLNSLNLEFNIDEAEGIDCKNVYEMVSCLDTIQQALEEKEKQDHILEILKRASKEADVFELNPYSYSDYPYSIEDGSDGYRCMELTPEEYYLLKQWLEEEQE